MKQKWGTIASIMWGCGSAFAGAIQENPRPVNLELALRDHARVPQALVQPATSPEFTSKSTSDISAIIEKGCFDNIARQLAGLQNPRLGKHLPQICHQLFGLVVGPFPSAFLGAIIQDLHDLHESDYQAKNCVADQHTLNPLVHPGDSLIHAAVSVGAVDKLKVLLHYAFDPGRQNRSPMATSHVIGASPVHYAVTAPCTSSTEIIDLLLDHGAPPNAVDPFNRTPLHIAAATPSVCTAEILVALLRRGAYINQADAAGLHPLHYALAYGNARGVEILARHGAQLQYPDKLGNTPLHWGAYFNSAHALETLLNINPALTLELKNADGRTALMLAAAPRGADNLVPALQSAEALQVLIKHRARLNVTDNAKNTPLHLAAAGGFLESVKTLLIYDRSQLQQLNQAGLSPEAVSRKHCSSRQPCSSILEILASSAGRIRCPEVRLVPNARIMLSDTVRYNYLVPGDMVTYTCNPGHVRVGAAQVFCQKVDDRLIYVPNPPVCLPEAMSKPESSAFWWYLIAAIVVVIIGGLGAWYICGKRSSVRTS